MKKQNKKAPKPVFGVKQDGKERYFRFGVDKLNLSPYGVISAEDAIQKPGLIKDLIDNKSFVLSEATKADYEAYEKDKAEREEKAAEVNMSTSYEARINKLESQLKEAFDQKVTQSVVATSVKVEAPVGLEADVLNEEKTGEKPGTKKEESKPKSK